MGWMTRLGWIFVLGGVLAGCAGSAHELPSVSEAESQAALDEIQN